MKTLKTFDYVSTSTADRQAGTHTFYYLFLHVGHLHRGFVPQLKRQTQIHFNSFVDQVLQGRHGLTGALQHKPSTQMFTNDKITQHTNINPLNPVWLTSPWRIGGCQASLHGHYTAGCAHRCCQWPQSDEFPCNHNTHTYVSCCNTHFISFLFLFLLSWHTLPQSELTRCCTWSSSSSCLCPAPLPPPGLLWRDQSSAEHPEAPRSGTYTLDRHEKHTSETSWNKCWCHRVQADRGGHRNFVNTPDSSQKNTHLASQQLLRPTFAFIRKSLVFFCCHKSADTKEKCQEKFHCDSLLLKLKEWKV